jgi:hypothetical protein
MALQTARFRANVLQRPPWTFVNQYNGLLRRYEETRRLFLAALGVIESDLSRKDDIDGMSEESSQHAWQLILLLQLVGEHLGFTLEELPMSLSHG